MVSWVVDYLDITDTVIGSFKSKDLRKMYHLPQPQKNYDTQFIHKFMQENLNHMELIREWRRDPNKHKFEDRGMYSLASIIGPFSHIFVMLCFLYGYPNT